MRILSFNCTFLCSVRLLFIKYEKHTTGWNLPFSSSCTKVTPQRSSAALNCSCFRASLYLWKITNWRKRYAKHAIDYCYICWFNKLKFHIPNIKLLKLCIGSSASIFTHFYLAEHFNLTYTVTKSKWHIPNIINMKSRVCSGTAVEYIKITLFAN